MWKKLSETAMREGMKVLSSPRVMRLMSDPRVMKMMMQAFAMRTTIQGVVDKSTRELAHRLHLVTEEEVLQMRSKLRDLESSVARMRMPDAEEEEEDIV